MRKSPTVAIVGFSTFILCISILHLIQPEFAFSSRFMSEYALGEFGWVLNIAIFGNLVGSIAYIVALYNAFPGSYRSFSEIILFGIAALTILTNFFPTDVYGKATTVYGHIHNLGAFIGSITALIFFLLHSFRLQSMGLLKGFYLSLLYLSLVAPVLFVALIILNQFDQEIIGIIQRVYSLMVLGWLIVAANGIRTLAIVPD